MSKLIVSEPIKAKVMPSTEEELEDISIENSTVLRTCINQSSHAVNQISPQQHPDIGISVMSDTVECSCEECHKSLMAK